MSIPNQESSHLIAIAQRSMSSALIGRLDAHMQDFRAKNSPVRLVPAKQSKTPSDHGTSDDPMDKEGFI